MRQEERKKRGGKKAKSKVMTTVSLLNPKVKILLSAHAQTSQANILHLDQKAANCM